MRSDSKARLAILASGAGSNADVICGFFSSHPAIRVSLIMTNNSQAGVLQVAARHHLKALVVPRREWRQPDELLAVMASLDITHLVLAGFLQLIDPKILHAFPGRMLNIHPALLPDFGGKGMYGLHVHRAVLAAGRPVSGITIHEVNEDYDQGRILFQAETPVDALDTPETLAQKIHALEHRHYPEVIEHWITG